MSDAEVKRLAEQKLQDPNVTEAGKEAIRHDPAAAKDITTGTGVGRVLMADIRTKEGTGREKLDNEAGGETSKPATGPTGATTEGLGAHAAPGSAASGMARRDFDKSIAKETKGAENVDGPMEPQHLHQEHGEEARKSKAYNQMSNVHEPKDLPEGAYATHLPEDHPVKQAGSHHGRT